MKILIIEDEDLAIQKLKDTLKAVESRAEIVGVATSIRTAVDWLQQNPAPDIILMDIELSDGQSFEIFNRIEIRSPVIFTTSYDEYAIRAFKVNSIDYLLKPVEEEDLRMALEKYHRLEAKFARNGNGTVDMQRLVNELKDQMRSGGYRNRFLVRQGQQWVSVEADEIAYFFAQGRLCYFVCWNKQKYVVDYTLEDLQEMMDPQQFFRASRGYLIHIRSVQQIHNYFNGKLKLSLKPSTIQDDVVVSRERAAEFKNWMGK